ncbi:FAD/NAD(P)-binding domain-containing protein [Wilcoxina mikolae CBS 423.85]|nr:FAD/NAD(P)-binding domain-containing protein [Wilcoxina mikolae CBS 423.85]
MPTKKHILIIGGGISGLAFALQVLTHASKHYTVTIYEKSPHHSIDRGFCIILSPNAVHILRSLDLDLVATGCARPLTHTRVISPHNETLLAENNIFPSDPESLLTVERSGLVSLLLSRVLEAGGHVEWDRRLVAMNPDATGVSVEFEHGEKAHGDLVVGADGVHSTVRRLLYTQLPSLPPVFGINLLTRFLFPRETWQAKPTRWSALYGISKQLPNHLLTDDGTMHLYTLPGSPGAYATYSLPSNRLFWICYESSSPSDSLGDAEFSRQAFTHLPYRAGTFGEVMEGSEKIRRVRLFHTVFEHICNREENVVLIGDAAHPQATFVGQGAGRGLEEGVELCNALLRGCWKEGKGGVGCFVENAKERSRRVADMGWWAGVAVMGDWCVIRWVRDVVLWWIARGERKRREEGRKRRKERVGNPDGAVEVRRKKDKGSWLFDYRPCVITEEEFWDRRNRSEQYDE